jgi:hypothetical protein
MPWHLSGSYRVCSEAKEEVVVPVDPGFTDQVAQIDVCCSQRVSEPSGVSSPSSLIF